MRYDPQLPEVGRYEYVARDLDDRPADLGIRDRVPPESSLVSQGSGHLRSKASDRIEERLDLEEYRGEHIATVWIDCAEWEYAVEWVVEVPLGQRLRSLLPTVERAPARNGHH